MAAGSRTEQEVASQPACWREAALLADGLAGLLPASGERVAVAGCGTSWFMAQAYAAAREEAGQGETDAFAASEMPAGRRYDRVLVLSRSGTTTEIVQLLGRLAGTVPTVAITAVRGQPVDGLTDAQLVLDFADERSVVQTRFPTTVLALARHAFGEDLTQAVADARQALQDEMPADPADIDHLVFLGTGWTYGLANEAALKVREAAQAYSESYPAKDFRHGPVAVCGPRSLVWSFGDTDPELDELSKTAGATAYRDKKDPLAQLVLAQRFALALAAHRGLDPDHPRLLTRSVVLTP
jgi:fructoselysine-6-P-deglycase FrlB-like protein